MRVIGDKKEKENRRSSFILVALIALKRVFRVAEGRERRGQLLLSRERNKKNLMEQVGVDYQAGRPWLSHAVSTVRSAQVPVYVPNSC